MHLMNELNDAVAAVEKLASQAVQRHRAAGILTWALLHQIEAQVLEEVTAGGEHRQCILRMLGASRMMHYPRDQRAVSLEGHSIVPIVFGEIIRAWDQVH